LEEKTMSGITANETMALAVIPNNDLALVAKNEGAKAKRLHKTAVGAFIGALSAGPLITCAGVAMMASAPVLAPIVGMLGIVLYFGGSITGVVLENNQRKALGRQAQAVKTRADHLTAAARAALDAAIEEGTIRAGSDLSIVLPDETLKRVCVESVGMVANVDGGKKLSITARILEEDGKPVDWMKQCDRVSLEYPLAAFPKTVLGSIWTEALPAAAESTIAPEPPTAREPEKTLPRINIPLSLGN
jgi:hypothetical protein